MDYFVLKHIELSVQSNLLKFEKLDWVYSDAAGVLNWEFKSNQLLSGVLICGLSVSLDGSGLTYTIFDNTQANKVFYQNSNQIAGQIIAPFYYFNKTGNIKLSAKSAGIFGVNFLTVSRLDQDAV